MNGSILNKYKPATFIVIAVLLCAIVSFLLPFSKDGSGFSLITTNVFIGTVFGFLVASLLMVIINLFTAKLARNKYYLFYMVFIAFTVFFFFYLGLILIGSISSESSTYSFTASWGGIITGICLIILLICTHFIAEKNELRGDHEVFISEVALKRVNDPIYWLFHRSRDGSRIFKLLTYVILIFACVIALYPVLRILSVSLRPGDRLLSTTLDIIPKDATMESYRKVLFEKDFFVWIWNSLIITISTAIFGLILASASGYAFSRWNFKGKNSWLVFLFTTQMIPAAMLMVPIFIIAVNIGTTTGVPIVNTYRGLVLAYAVGAIPFSIWMLKGYYDTIPQELEEAAMIDGLTRIETFVKIILPLSKPALAICFLFNFMNSWSDYMLARVMLSKSQMFTWPQGLQSMQSQFRAEWGAYSAAALLVAIPVMALFFMSSKYLMSGLTIGSVKG